MIKSTGSDRFACDDGGGFVGPDPDTVAAARFDGSLQVIQISFQGAGVEDHQPIFAGREIDLLDSVNNLLLVQH
jgi:hypothetical protein